MRKISLNYRYMLKHVLIAVALGYGYFVFSKREYSLKSFADAFFLVGIVYLIIGLFRLARRMHCYDLLIFGTKKTVELVTNKNYSKANSKTGEYLDFYDKYNKLFIEFIGIGVVFNIISIILATI